MTVSKYQFRHELRLLIDTQISSSSTFEDYVSHMGAGKGEEQAVAGRREIPGGGGRRL
ncbi:hypothetical protein [Bradyrhizobium sp. 195]|uniref:hypothetical protein n=1 Tax=Bradyrhizobium sp. 195 TaxID=2782662 RepID=UPI002001497C|nr:hypothetical protein [Bradyrhizobium sp. 195]UPK30828.1 hypothetical protein IVB26_05735 [Bradyrhizobium sp. 195]